MVNARAAYCELQTYNDLSMKFRGFEPGYNVFVVGPFALRASADSATVAARRCFPGAYVKYAEYFGG